MNVSRPNLDLIIPKLISLVEEVGSFIAAQYTKDIEITKKVDGSPVTEIDNESQKLLKQGLSQITPNIPIISEEDETSWSIKSELYWLIDPLDGTKGFIFKTGDFCINIALMENLKPVFGLIHIPLSRETYFGYEKKAFRFFEGQNASIQTRSFPQQGVTLLLGGYGQKHKDQENFFLRTFPVDQTLRLRSAIKFCLIASGQADIYIRFEPCSEWDTAAGQAIVEAAGGIMTLIDGKPFTYGKPNLLNPAFVVFGRKP
jgi:3'(2'), 5'-bisphosphate nucleotidase